MSLPYQNPERKPAWLRELDRRLLGRRLCEWRHVIVSRGQRFNLADSGSLPRFLCTDVLRTNLWVLHVSVQTWASDY